MIRNNARLVPALVAVLAMSPPRVSSPTRTVQLVPDPRAVAVRDAFVAELAPFERAAAELEEAVRSPATTASARARVRDAFNKARLAYKRVEFFVEYYASPSALQLNGPPVDEVELEGSVYLIIPASGFQLLEGMLFPKFDAANRANAANEAQGIHEMAPYLRGLAPTLPMRDTHIFDAIRLEIARITVMGLVGFDSPVLHESLAEAVSALGGIGLALEPYRRDLTRANSRLARRLDSLLAGAKRFIAASTFDDFNRLEFITAYANPLANAVAAARTALNIELPREQRFWRVEAPTVFEADAFDPEVLRAPGMPDATPAAVTLGEKLFSEPAMSGGGGRSCASCHHPDRAFTDGLPTSASLTHGTRLRNAPTLINASLQRMQFADMKTAYLEDQVETVVSNQNEMRGALETTAIKLGASAEYRRLFAAAFPGERDSVISATTIRAALAAYVRSLNRLNSRADRAFRGDTSALSAEERRGFNLFAGKAGCATCHFLPLTNNTVPPVFERAEAEVLGGPVAPVWQRATVDPDTGMIAVTSAPMHRYAFKTQSVRNSAVTAPYMHNGVYRTLDEVVRFYDGGGGAGIGIHLPNQTLAPDSLHLTASEKRALVRFMEAMTDTTGLGGIDR